MRVQHVWAKTGTSPVAFHNTTVDVPLCPAREGCPGVGLPPRSKANNSVISNGPGRLWRRLIPLTRWFTLLSGRSAAARRSRPAPATRVRPVAAAAASAVAAPPPSVAAPGGVGGTARRRYLPDWGNHRVRVGTLAEESRALAAPGSFVVSVASRLVVVSGSFVASGASRSVVASG